MRRSPDAPNWTRHLVYRTQHARTTWKLRLGILAFLALAAWVTRGWWTVAVGRSLVCNPNGTPSDAILVENFDPDYLVFERASQLRRDKLAPRVLVPTQAEAGNADISDVAVEVAEVMAKAARLGAFDIVPIRHVEPISLNA